MFGKLGLRIARPSPGTAIASLALLVSLGGVAVAAIPGTDGRIHGCYAKSAGVLGIPHNKGDLRIVDAGEACRSDEAAISWDQNQAPPPAPAPAPAGVSGWELVSSSGTGFATAHCPIGKRLVGGGSYPEVVQRAFPSPPEGDGGSWFVDSTHHEWPITAVAICVDAAP